MDSSCEFIYPSIIVRLMESVEEIHLQESIARIFMLSNYNFFTHEILGPAMICIRSFLYCIGTCVTGFLLIIVEY